MVGECDFYYCVFLYLSDPFRSMKRNIKKERVVIRFPSLTTVLLVYIVLHFTFVNPIKTCHKCERNILVLRMRVCSILDT